MGQRKKRFVKPVYEISLEAHNKVYIREEDKGPFRRFVSGFVKYVIIPVAAFAVATLFLQILQNTFLPPQLHLEIRHISTDAPLTPTELRHLRVYFDDNKRATRSIIKADGIHIPFRKKGSHIIGLENLASQVDSSLFLSERAYIKNIRLARDVRKNHLNGDLPTLIFHRVVSRDRFVKGKILFYEITSRQDNTLRMYTSLPSAPQILTFSSNSMSPNENIFWVKWQTGLAGLTVRNRILGETGLEILEQKAEVELPQFTSYYWADQAYTKQLYDFAERLLGLTSSALVLLPHITEREGEQVADVVVAFAPLGGVKFQPILVRNCSANPLKPDFLAISKEASLFDLLEKYLFIHEDFVTSKVLHDNLIMQFVDFCNRLSPNVSQIIYYDNMVVRAANGKSQPTEELNLEALLSNIEPLTCMPLYERLLLFWQKDVLEIRDEVLGIRNREILRAIIRRSLALKAEKHLCSEQNWPTREQQIKLFEVMQQNLQERVKWQWLSSEPWLDMVKSELDSLNKK